MDAILGNTNCSTTLAECVPELQDLAYDGLNRSVYLGGQDFNRGCLMALNASLDINETSHTIVKTSHFMFDPSVNVSSVLLAARHGTVCKSTDGSAPVVSVPLDWCLANLPGWEAQTGPQVLGPLVQFILPCVAFCYNIPREWKLRLNPLARRRKFRLKTSTSVLEAFLLAVQKLLNAVVALGTFGLELSILILDTFVWMSMCFAMAGPMIVSAAYEYRLDWNNLVMLAARGDDIPHVSRARLLLCTVVGNMRLRDNEGGKDEELLELLESQSESTWTQVMSIAGEVARLDKQSNQKRFLNLDYDLVQAASHAAGDQRVGPRLKLQTLLDAQPGFGGYIGAPVVFFVGGFGYNIADSYSSRGNEVVAITLAFGMWWMYIPHTAVLANTLLASNDPSTLQGLVGKRSVIDNDTPPPPTDPQNNQPGQRQHWVKRQTDRVVRMVTRDAYDSTYKPVALWRRGPNKQRWMIQAIQVIKESDDCPQNLIDDMERSLIFHGKDWVFAISLTMFLLSIPFTLAFTTSYLTPKKGLSCRSLTQTIFMATQVVQVAIWAVETHRKFSYARPKATKAPPQELHKPGKRWVQVITRTANWVIFFQVQFLKKLISVLESLSPLLKWLSRLAAVFTAIGGTLMQIMGVYDNCYCNTDAWSWTDWGNAESRVTPLGDGISESEIKASENWIIMGALASGILSMVTALGWWHRKKLWKRFKEQTKTLPDIEPPKRLLERLNQVQSASDSTMGPSIAK